MAASGLILGHLRDAWNHLHGSAGEEQRLERLPIVLTVPASFDEEARELTVQAAREAGFEHLTLLEEPLAALYAWISSHRRELSTIFGSAALLLVCDVGGGTTDFSLIRASVDDGDRELRFERIAIGEHLLLGGDNLDLALAVLAEQKLGEAAKLTLTQRQSLRRKCSAAKEQLLSDPALQRVTITILGAGRGVVGGGMTTELTRDEVVAALAEGFLPIGRADDLPARDRRVGLRELGLPYESEPAITKHLAAFLARAGANTPGSPLARPDAVLFNGGFFTPSIARDRVLDALQSWFGDRPLVLENQRPEAAVALGAAFYGRLRADQSASKRLLIRAGSARAYYVGIAGDGRPAVCVMPRGTEEGTRIPVDREFTVVTNEAAAFTLYSSTQRTDTAGHHATLGEADDVQRHAPLVTALRFGKRSRRVPLAVRLTAVFTETGTLELWLESASTEHRWRLAFNLRGAESDPLEDAADAAEESSGVVIADEAILRAGERIRDVFDTGTVGPDVLVGDLETTLGHGKAAWPLAAIRRLADVLLEVAPARNRSAAHEARWLNLTGFCIRPGFGSSKDGWRVSELRKVYVAGLAYPRDIQNQVEWTILWQRVAAGFSTGQQRELAQRTIGILGLGQRKAPRLNAQIEREAWRLLASLERLDAGQRARLGEDLLERIRREPRSATWLWAIGRLGARVPFYGPLNNTVPPQAAEQWVLRLLALKPFGPDAANAVAQLAARTGDPARDLSLGTLEQAAGQLEGLGMADLAEQLRVSLPGDRQDAARIFGESLPEGLRLA